jgi:hypothetical protein
LLFDLEFRQEDALAGIGNVAILSPVVVAVLISGGGFILSVGTSMFISGTQWGKMSAKVDSIDARMKAVDTMPSDVKILQHDLAEIKGMFTMRLKEPAE